MAQGYTGQGQPEQGAGVITLHASLYSYITQGGWVDNYTGNILTYNLLFNATNTQNDQVDYFVWLSKGTYTFQMVGTEDTAYAISTILIDGVSVGTLDWYDTTSYNNLKQITGITIATTGRHILSIKAATRHASSTGWYLAFYTLALFRTA